MVGVSFQALIADKQAGGGGGGYSFNMTAGNISGTTTGYDTGSYGVFGSIDAEPIPAFPINLVIYSSVVPPQFIFFGDATALLVGKQVYVAGVAYPFATNWTLTGGDTIGDWGGPPGIGPIFVSGLSYFIEIKP